MNSIGERIIFLRENLDLSQVKLATLIGITKMTLYKYEKNICEPRGEIIARLAKALNTTTDYILGCTDDFSPADNGLNTGCIIKAREVELIARYRRLDSDNKARIEERIDSMLESQTQN